MIADLDEFLGLHWQPVGKCEYMVHEGHLLVLRHVRIVEDNWESGRTLAFVDQICIGTAVNVPQAVAMIHRTLYGR